jgi:hypothetical protein
VPPAIAADFKNSRRCMNTQSGQEWKRHQFYSHRRCWSFSKDAFKIKIAEHAHSSQR